MTLILVLDFGGTKLAAATVNKGSRQWLNYEHRMSPIDANATTDLVIMRELADSLLKGAKPTAIGVSFGGPVDATTGTVRLSHHVLGWQNILLKKILQEEFNVPVSVDNDANVAALGEYHYGAGQGFKSIFYITISTGVGGGWILNSQPWRGAEGMAGEIGHMVVDPTRPLCLCGKRGCVERLASGSYMAEDVREILHKKGDRAEKIRELVGNNLELVTGKVVSDGAMQGDALAQEILYRGAWGLGVGIGNVANLINPQLFVLGGSVTKAGAKWWQVVQETARQTALPEVNFEVVPAALGDDAPLWGAVALATQALP